MVRSICTSSITVWCSSKILLCAVSGVVGLLAGSLMDHFGICIMVVNLDHYNISLNQLSRVKCQMSLLDVIQRFAPQPKVQKLSWFRRNHFIFIFLHNWMSSAVMMLTVMLLTWLHVFHLSTDRWAACDLCVSFSDQILCCITCSK